MWILTPFEKKKQPNHFLLLSLSQKNQSVALCDAINEMFRHICGALGDDKFTYLAFHQIATKKLGRSFGACPTAMHVCFATLSWLFGVPLPCSLPGGCIEKDIEKCIRIRTNVEFKQMWHTLGSPELANVFLFRHRNWNSSNRHWSSSMRPSLWSLRRPLTIGFIGGLTQPTSTSTVTSV